MKSSTIILSAALAASLAVVAWLARENSALRAETAGPPRPGPPSAAATAQGFTAAPSTAAGHGRRAEMTARRDHRPEPLPADDVTAMVQSGELAVRDNGDGTVTLVEGGSGFAKVVKPEELGQLAREAHAAAAVHLTKRPGGPSWSPGQAAGAPDTLQHGDYSTAWASQQPDGGREWLRLTYGKAVEVSEVNIHETYNPGALSKVSAIMPDGSERVLWEGTGTPEEGVIERTVKVPPGIRSDQILVELDTARVPGWNEIDAVELVGRDGSRQWAAESTASSYYGEGRESSPLVEGLRLERY
jgi:hypothetical protein